jgi:hypothetical protein
MLIQFVGVVGAVVAALLNQNATTTSPVLTADSVQVEALCVAHDPERAMADQAGSAVNNATRRISFLISRCTPQ